MCYPLNNSQGKVNQEQKPINSLHNLICKSHDNCASIRKLQRRKKDDLKKEVIKPQSRSKLDRKLESSLPFYHSQRKQVHPLSRWEPSCTPSKSHSNRATDHAPEGSPAPLSKRTRNTSLPQECLTLFLHQCPVQPYII